MIDYETAEKLKNGEGYFVVIFKTSLLARPMTSSEKNAKSVSFDSNWNIYQCEFTFKVDYKKG